MAALLCLFTAMAMISESVSASVENLEIDVDGYGGIRVTLSGNMWLSSSSFSVRNNGVTVSNGNFEPGPDDLILDGEPSTDVGSDDWGSYVSGQFHWKTKLTSWHFDTYVNRYNDIPVVVFGQRFVDGAKNTSLAYNNDTVSSFPTFGVEQSFETKLGYFSLHGGQIKSSTIAPWSEVVYHGADGGLPLVIFDNKLENAVIMSPLNAFMISSITSSSSGQFETTVGFGLLSTVNEVPKGYVYETVLVAGQNITGVYDRWGKLMRLKFKKEDYFRKGDFTLNYLGYWTDNGACYYHYHGAYPSYEDVFSSLTTFMEKESLPYRYIQLDDWWFFWGENGGMKNWTAMPDVFPDGTEAVTKITGLPIHSYNKYFAVETDYAKQNGGKFNFIIDRANRMALPNDVEFWPWMLKYGRDNYNIQVFEQDFLHTTFDKLTSLQTDLYLGRTWLTQMGDAAQSLGLTVQYCMSYPRHALQSLEIPAVTQIRVSGDYQPGNTNWMIGDSTILAHALGLAAFKDNFHTVPEQEECRFTVPEPYPALETYIAALSGGPVGPSDSVGMVNRTLVMATCMSDGRLLKPTRPAMSLDSTFVYRAFGSDGPNGVVTAAYSEVAGLTWYYVLAADLQQPYQMSVAELPPSHSVKPKTHFPLSVAVRYTLDGKVVRAVNLSGANPLMIDECGRDDFQYWVIAPLVCDMDGVLLGELDKVVTASEARIVSIALSEHEDGNVCTIKVRGVPGETVHMTTFGVKAPGAFTADCMIAADGTAEIQIKSIFSRIKCAH